MSLSGNKFLSPTTTSLIFAGIMAVLGMGTATALRWKFRLESDLSITPVSTQSPQTKATPKLPSIDEGPIRDAEDTHSQSYIGGTWMYDLTGRRTLVKQEGNNVEFYIDDPMRGQVRIGRGVVTEDGVRATIDVRGKNRSADINLRLSDDGRRLEGWFTGINPQEGGHVTLTKVG